MRSARPVASLAGLHPGWAGLGLGTGGVGTATAALHSLHPGAGWITWIAILVLAIALVGSLAGLVIYGVRLARHRARFIADWSSPAVAPAFAMLPGGLAVTAIGMRLLADLPGGREPGSAVGRIGAASGAIAVPIGISGILLAVVVISALAFSAVAGTRGSADSVNGVWLVPGTVVMLGSIFIGTLIDIGTGEPVLLEAADAALLGCGLVVTGLTLGLLASRLIRAGRPPPDHIVSLVTVVSPLSVGATAVLATAQRAGPDSMPLVVPAARLVATGLWGAALAWLPAAILLVWRTRSLSKGGFTPAWWAFVFPTAAFAEAALLVGASWGSRALGWFGMACWVVVLCVWASVIGLASRDLARGRWDYPR